jgi:hypothetical protein
MSTIDIFAMAGLLSIASAVIAVRCISNVGLALAVGLPTYWLVIFAMTVTGLA